MNKTLHQIIMSERMEMTMGTNSMISDPLHRTIDDRHRQHEIPTPKVYRQQIGYGDVIKNIFFRRQKMQPIELNKSNYQRGNKSINYNPSYKIRFGKHADKILEKPFVRYIAYYTSSPTRLVVNNHLYLMRVSEGIIG